jgi:hypothetical protein
MRRHLYVHDGHVRTVRKALPQEIVRVAGLSCDVEAGLDEEARYPLPEQHVVLTDHNAQLLVSHNENGTRCAAAGG